MWVLTREALEVAVPVLVAVPLRRRLSAQRRAWSRLTHYRNFAPQLLHIRRNMAARRAASCPSLRAQARTIGTARDLTICATRISMPTIILITPKRFQEKKRGKTILVACSAARSAFHIS